MGNLTLHNEMSHKDTVKIFFSLENFCNELQRCNSKKKLLTTKIIAKNIVKNSKKNVECLENYSKNLSLWKKLTIKKAKSDNSRDNNDKNLFLQISNSQDDGREEKNDGSFGFYCSHHYRKQRMRALRTMVKEQLWQNLNGIPHLMNKNGKTLRHFPV